MHAETAKPQILSEFIGSCSAMFAPTTISATDRHVFANHITSSPPQRVVNQNGVPASPRTPPSSTPSPANDDAGSYDLDGSAEILETATHVLDTEAAGLLSLSKLYAHHPICRDGFVRAVNAIAESQGKDGKTIVVGVGKSGKVGDKLVASMNSLGLVSYMLNPVDALHGDLGVIRRVSYHPFSFLLRLGFAFPSHPGVCAGTRGGEDCVLVLPPLARRSPRS